MIYVTRLDHNTMVVNVELLATVESTPDTLLTHSNGHQFLRVSRASGTWWPGRSNIDAR